MSINLNRFAGQELYVLLFDQPCAILWMPFCKGLIVLFTEPCLSFYWFHWITNVSKVLTYCFAGSESHSAVVLYHLFCVYDLSKCKSQALIATNKQKNESPVLKQWRVIVRILKTTNQQQCAILHNQFSIARLQKKKIYTF